MSVAIPAITAAVQANCDISDAAFAQDMTLCNYLLAMREHFRWEKGLPVGVEPERAAVGQWISEREARWEAIAGRDFGAIPLAEAAVDPFDVRAVNDEILPQGWAYGAATGRFGKPHFFLGRLVRREHRGSVEILEVGREVARDLEASPAQLVDDTIVIRREAFERWLWTSAEAWALTRKPGAMQAALQHYRYDDDAAGAILAMAGEQRETLLLHELGEHAAGLQLGAGWEAYIGRPKSKREELVARAVRDLLADCLVTLPAIVERRDLASLHFYFATFSGMRKSLFPALARAYDHLASGAASGSVPDAPWERLKREIEAARPHWERAARALAQGEVQSPEDPAALQYPPLP